VASVLELAAGTGAVTREQAAWLAPGVRLVAKDLDGSMLKVAHRRGPPVR
jgi:ubiquinone/menaquinone biosynthesis C-methylase UbiE